MMKMTKQQPTKPGWYWYSLPGSWPLQPALVFDGGPNFGLMYSLDAIDNVFDDSDRDGLKMHLASDDALWGVDPIEPPNEKVSGPEAALSPEGRARLPGSASD